jgi:lysophospholipase L1-like esterase
VNASALMLFRTCCTVALGFAMHVPSSVRAAQPSFADFDSRARAGERLSVVFFGASLTWGANASDPQRTSFRGQVADRLEAKYPQARFKFWDAAIGGTGSQLGVFRLDRDVLARKPDLVFLDFSANDDIYSDRRETLSSYESLVRRILSEAGCPVVQVVFPFQWNIAQGNLAGMKRRDAHHKIAAAYHTAIGDAIELALERVASKQTTIEQLWPVDGVHPCDAGYQLFADAAWSAFESAVAARQVCIVSDKMLFDDTYLKNRRVRLSSLAPLPAGWRVAAPNVVSAYFDMLMSRWLDDEVVASLAKLPPAKAEEALSQAKPDKAAPADSPAVQAIERLQLRFRGSMVMLFGESTNKSGKYAVYIDGRLIEHRDGDEKSPLLTEFDAGKLGKTLNGNTHLVQVLAEGLDPAIEHTLEIEPRLENADQEVRLESVCVAGGDATVTKAD